VRPVMIHEVLIGVAQQALTAELPPTLQISGPESQPALPGT
jgi:hypothetical protein